MSRDPQLPAVPSSTEPSRVRAPSASGQVVPRGGASEESDWQHYFGAIRRHRWVVVGVTVLGTALGLLASQLLRPAYSATALLWFEIRDRPGNTRDARNPESDELLNPSGWIDLVESNAVLEDVVRRQRLYLHPRDSLDGAALSTLQVDSTPVPGTYRYSIERGGTTFVLKKDGRVVETGSVTAFAGRALGFQWSPAASLVTPGRTVEFTLSTPADAARRLRKDLTVRTDVDPMLMHTGTSANFLRVQLAGSRPTELAATVNAIADRVVAVAADLKRIKLIELGRILDEQRQHALRTLRDAEAAQRDFRVRSAAVLRQGTPAVSPTTRGAGGDPLFERSFETKVALDSVQRDRQALGRALAQLSDSGVPVEALQAIGAVQKSAEASLALQEVTQKRATLRALRYRYTDASEPVRRLRSEVETLERSTIPTLVRGLDADLAAREEQLRRQTDSAFRYLRDLPPLALEEARLQRDVAIAEQLFTTVQQSYNETQLAAVSSLPDVRILDRAPVPERPDHNLTPLLACGSFIVSLGLAVFAVIMMDGLDRKVRYPEHVTQNMRLSILAAIPRFDWRHLGNGKSADAAAPVVEALRGLRLRLSHAGGPGPLLLTVTSPGIGEGKSFLSCNLALAFADAGYRTLLIDGDVRRGGQHRMLGLDRDPGLVDFLAARDLPVERITQTTRHPRLFFIACGSRRPSAPELLSADVMSGLIERVRAECGVVIVDSPPLAVGVDPLVLATQTGNVLLVLRAGVSDLELAAAKLDVLDSLPVRVLGAVLNDVRPYGAYRYYTYDAATYSETNGAGTRRRGAVSGGVLWGRS